MEPLDSEGLYDAIDDHDIEAIEGHLTAKGSPDAEAGVYDTALGHAVALDREEIAARLVDAGASLDLPNRHGNTPLHSAAYSGRLALARYLLGKGASSLHVKNNDGLTPAQLAEEHGHDDVAALLREPLDSEGLYDAIDDHDIEAIEGHLTAKGSPDAEAGVYDTALGHAVALDREEIAARLVDAGASLDLPNRHGNTPLHSAAYSGRLALARYLLGKGASSLHVKNNDGLTPAQLAEEHGHDDVAALLREPPAPARQAAGGAQVAENPAALRAEVLRLREANAQLQAERDQAQREAAAATLRMREEIAQLAARADALQAERDEALREAAAARASPPEGDPDPVPRLAAKLKDTVATKATLQAMGQDISALESFWQMASSAMAGVGGGHQPQKPAVDFVEYRKQEQALKDWRADAEKDGDDDLKDMIDKKIKELRKSAGLA